MLAKTGLFGSVFPRHPQCANTQTQSVGVGFQMVRRVGETIRRDTRYRIRPGVYAVLEKNGQVLLTHQAKPVPEFQLPGGGIDPGEHLLPALHREVKE